MGEEAQAVEEPDLDVFDEVEEEAQVEETEETETEAKDETDAEKGEKEEEPPASEDAETTTDTDAPKTVPISVMTAQRRENQRLKAELKAIQEAPDPVTDPEGFTKHVTVTTSEARIQDRIEDTRELMLEAHEDFADKEQLFLEMATEVDGAGERVVTNQALWNEMRSARNPAKFAYEKGVEHALYKERSAPDYEKQVEKRILAKLKKGGLNIDFDEIPDLTNVAATSKNTDFSEQEEANPNRLDMFDDD